MLQLAVDDRQLSGNLRLKLGVAAGQLAKLNQIASLGLQPLPALQLRTQLRGLARDASGPCGIVPDAGGG